jgi:hypothetical protein
MVDILGAAPWVVVSTAAAWFGQAYRHRHVSKKEKLDHADRLEIHRDELTIDLVKQARSEMEAAHAEVKELREEVRALRTLEQHFYYFQQSLDHLEALLSARGEARKVAERNARAFLTRMRSLDQEKKELAKEN